MIPRPPRSPLFPNPTRSRSTGTAPPRVWGEWGETTTTAGDLARFLARLPIVAHPADAATLLGWMRDATPTGSDGFDQQFRSEEHTSELPVTPISRMPSSA